MDASTDHDPSSSDKGEGDFISSLHQFSHDLRNKLSVINGFAALLLMDEELSPAHATYVQTILNGSKALDVAIDVYLVRAEATETSSIDLLNVEHAAMHLGRRDHAGLKADKAIEIRRRPLRPVPPAGIASVPPSQTRSCACGKWLPPYHRRGLRALQHRT